MSGSTVRVNAVYHILSTSIQAERNRYCLNSSSYNNIVKRGREEKGEEGKGKGTASHLPTGSNKPYRAVSTAEAVQQQHSFLAQRRMPKHNTKPTAL